MRKELDIDSDSAYGSISTGSISTSRKTAMSTSTSTNSNMSTSVSWNMSTSGSSSARSDTISKSTEGNVQKVCDRKSAGIRFKDDAPEGVNEENVKEINAPLKRKGKRW